MSAKHKMFMLMPKVFMSQPKLYERACSYILNYKWFYNIFNNHVVWFP